MEEMIDSPPGVKTPKMPGFVTGWMITDLVFVSLRTLSLPLSLIGFLVMSEKSVCYPAVAEALTALLLAATGLPGDIGLLCKKRWALRFCSAAAVVTVLGMGVSVWTLAAYPHAGLTPTGLYGFIVGASAAMMVRIALLVFYIIAVVRAADFFRESDF